MGIIQDLTARGLHLFPIKGGAKFPPLVDNWPAKATADADTLARTWPLDKDTNIGVHCIGLLVVDVDPKSGGVLSYKKLDTVHGFPLTYTVRTPSGGMHLYYRMADGLDAKNTVGKIAPGIDTRGRGGYVLAAGSRIASGDYTAEVDAPIVPAPQWLMDQIGEEPAANKGPPPIVPDAPEGIVRRAATWLRRAPRSIKGQGGDQVAYTVACGLRDFGVSYAQACSLMRSADWDYGCGWREGWLEEKPIRSAYLYADGEPGSKVALPEDFPVAAEPAEPRPPVIPDGPTRLSVFAKEDAGSTDYIIKGLLHRNSYVMLYGQPGEGKTFMALDMLFHIASGKEWHGRRVRQGTALYLAYEGMGGMRKRARALLHQYGDTDDPLYMDSASYNLREKPGRQALGQLIAAMPEKPAVIVFDTFAHALCGGDENSAQDVGAFNTGIKALITATGACVIVLHHPTKVGDSARGSSALSGAVDTGIFLEGGRLLSTKQRDVELAQPMGFKLVPVTIGVDADNDSITSCIVLPAPMRVEAKQEKLKGKFLLAWDKLCERRKDNTPITELEFKQACEEFLPRAADWPEVRMRLKRDGLIDFTEDGCIVRSMV